MNVDRARFLLLTTALSAATAVALSASGCTVVSDNTDGGNVPQVTPPGTDSGTDAADATATDASYTDGGDAGACLGDDGIAPTCEGGDVTCQTDCDGYAANYKKGIARAIGSCLEKIPTCTAQYDADRLACVDGAAQQACPDPTAEGYCVAYTCAEAGAGIQKADCEAIAKLLSPTGRDAFTACIATAGGPCAPNAATCIDNFQ